MYVCAFNMLVPNFTILSTSQVSLGSRGDILRQTLELPPIFDAIVSTQREKLELELHWLLQFNRIEADPTRHRQESILFNSTLRH